MEPRQDKPSSDRKIMEEIPQEPIAADPIDEGETKDGPEGDDEDDDDDDEIVGSRIGLEDERQRNAVSGGCHVLARGHHTWGPLDLGPRLRRQASGLPGSAQESRATGNSRPELI